VRENLTLATTGPQWGIVSRKRQGELVDRFMQRLGIKASAEQKIHELSGGNQQKVLLAWLCKNETSSLDEPTRGIDVGAKGEIQRLIELAEQGLRFS